MRRILTSFLFALALAAPPAHAAGLDELWTESTTVYEVGEFDGQPGLDLLIHGPSSNRLELRNSSTGALEFEFPNGHGGSSFGTLLENLDADAANEFVIHSLPPGDPSATRIALFEPAGAAAGGGAAPPPSGYGMTWEITNYGPIFDVSSVNMEGSGRRDLIVTVAANFRIHDSLDGTVKFDWQQDGPANMRFEALEVLDLDQDGRDELLVTSTNLNTFQVAFHVMKSNVALGVGDGPAYETRALALQNAPNPFSGPTSVSFHMPARGPVSIQVFDAAGRRVRVLREESLAPGRHTITWDGRDDDGRTVRSGVYFYEVEAAGQRAARKMLRVR